MKKIFKSKKLLYIGLPLLAIGFIAGVPIDEDKTILDQLIAAFPSAEATVEQQAASRKTLDDVWEEVQKLSDYNGHDSITWSGKVRLFDNLDERGITEQQNFILKQAGPNQWFHLDSLDRFQLEKTYLVIDHSIKEITIRAAGAADSIMNAMKLMEPQKMKEMLIKDGTTAEIVESGSEKTLTIRPGLMDAVNRYEIVYDKNSYQLKKFRLFYTSVPYQDYVHTTPPKQPEPLKQEPAPTPEGEGDELELNITEYGLELDIQVNEKGCDLNFTTNRFYRIQETGAIVFEGKLAGYRKISF